VRSQPLLVPGHDTPVLLGGRFDTAFGFDDGSYGLVDYKTSDPKSDHVRRYGRQLHAYVLAAENPAPGNLMLKTVTQMGLLCVEPVAMVAAPTGVAYAAIPKWVEIERDDAAFLAFLSRVLDVLESPI